ncbi:hypothetical protein ACWEJ6_44615 [Nonomuraea sp. NPDC004702]
MTMLKPDPNFHLDEFAKTALHEHADGYRAAILWLATSPPKHEVAAVARIWRDLHDGGPTGCETRHLNADEYPSFIDYHRGGPNELLVIDGEQEMAEINAAQGTNYPAWPKRAFAVSFDQSYILGFANACATALNMGASR